MSKNKEIKPCLSCVERNNYKCLRMFLNGEMDYLMCPMPPMIPSLMKRHYSQVKNASGSHIEIPQPFRAWNEHLKEFEAISRN